MQFMSRITLTLTHIFSHLLLRLKIREFMLLTCNGFCSITLKWKHLFCFDSEDELRCAELGGGECRWICSEVK